MDNKTCCISGHRDIPDDKIEYVRQELRKEVLSAIEDGFVTFLSGFEQGADLLFASIVAELKQENNLLELEAVIPFSERQGEKDEEYKRLIQYCDCVSVHNEDSCNSFFKRKAIMLEESRRVIVVYDGRRTGGTAFAVRAAMALNREIRVIRI